MKWKKLGRIFNPVEHKLPNNCIEFAQSPQTVVFDDFVRIYFSTREKDKSGMYLSHIAFIDMDKELKRIKNISSAGIIENGKLGSFDEHGIFPINLLKREKDVIAYTCGWSRRNSVPVETSIGYAVSNDNGLTFTKPGDGPIMSSSLHEPFLVGDAFVKIYNGSYHMWYIFGTKWTTQTDESPARVYKIAYASSQDGIEWKRDSRLIIPDKINEDECQALPTVIYYKGKYHMYFCYRHATGFRKNSQRGYRIGYAYSDDMKNWIRDDETGGIDVSDSGWDSEMNCYPHIFSCNEKIYLLYNGNEFGRFGFGAAVLED